MAKFVCNVISYTLMRAVDITVVIPTPTIPQAGERAASQDPCVHTPRAKYPVVYLLHGFGNNNATWTAYTNVELYAEERNIAIVNIDAENKAYIRNGMDDYYKFISGELPDFICGMFPVSGRPEDTFIAGLSMGGYGTLVHGLNFPEKYAAMGTFSAACSLPDQKAFPDPRLDPARAAEQMYADGKIFPKIFMACGGRDMLLSDNLAFRDLLLKLGADVTWEEDARYGHEWRFWDREVERFLDWLPRTDYYASLGKRRI